MSVVPGPSASLDRSQSNPATSLPPPFRLFTIGSGAGRPTQEPSRQLPDVAALAKSGRASSTPPGHIRHRPVRLWQGRHQPRCRGIALYFRFFDAQVIVVPHVGSRFGDRSKSLCRTRFALSPVCCGAPLAAAMQTKPAWFRRLLKLLALWTHKNSITRKLLSGLRPQNSALGKGRAAGDFIPARKRGGDHWLNVFT